jgi:hypothetical protein
VKENNEIEVEITTSVPVVVHEGRYRLYRKPDGGMRVQYKRDDREEEDFFEMPGEAMQLAEGMATGKLSAVQFVSAAVKMMGKMRVLYHPWRARSHDRRSGPDGIESG